MNVTVADPFQVCHEGKAYGPGKTVDVPDEVAGEWIALGWAAKRAKGASGSVTRRAKGFR